MNQELKEQAHKEFDEKFAKLRGLRPHLDFEDLWLFIDSLIDKTVQIERERVFEIIKKEKLTWTNQSIGYKAVESVEMALSEITNKSDINKDTL